MSTADFTDEASNMYTKFTVTQNLPDACYSFSNGIPSAAGAVARPTNPANTMIVTR